MEDSWALWCGTVDQVAPALAASADTHHVLITSGSFDLLSTTFFKTQDELSSFVRKYLGTVPGVVSHEVMFLMNVTRNSLGADRHSVCKPLLGTA